MVNSLFYCSEINVLVSSSVDCTIRIWNVEECEAVDCVQTEQKRPPLYIRGTKKGDTFFSFSRQGMDLWAVRNLYTLHHQLGREDAPVRHIAVSQLPAPYPTRVLCISGDCNVTLLAEETGSVLTSFKAMERILCADYCLHKEILLVLTEAGTVLQTNTLSNPITVMQEWKGIGQGPWQRTDHMTKKHAKNLPVPGLACCLVLYSCVADTQKALEEWQSLQEGRGCSHRKYIELDDAKNKFLIIIGQNGGCVSVLKSDNGKVLLRTQAHNGQRVTSMQACPENHCLLTSGEDLTVVVWRVYPYVEECLSQQMSLQCDQPQVYLATLGSQLALTFQELSSGSYRLKLFNLLDQTDYQPREGHSDHFTGLCGIPELMVFASSSLDKTLCFWNEENQLIRTLQLQAVPQCLAYSRFGGQLYLGIRGDLYKMRFTKFLPHNYRERLHCTHGAELLPDTPIPVDKETYSQTNTSKDEEEMLQAIANNRVLIGGMKQQESLVTTNMDLEALFQSSVKCRKEKPPSTKQTKKEAFDRYMNIIYGLPLINKIEVEDIFDPAKYSVCPETKYVRPRNLPRIKQDVRPRRKEEIPVNVEKKKKRKPPKTPTKVLSPPVEKVTPEKPVIVKKPVRVKKKEEPVAEIIKPVEQPKPRTPIPPRPGTPTPTPTPPPPREPSPEVPTFLKQFAEMGWFRDLYPDKKSIPDNPSAEDFSRQLLNYLQTCCTTSKIKILGAIRALHQQGLLHNTDELYGGLIDSLQTFARPHMSPVERIVLTEMLNLLVHLKSEISYNLMMKLLTLLAYKELDLRKPALRLLGAIGVHKAEQWLWPELESWESELEDQSNTWESLHGKADCWLELWISKFKKHNRHLDIGNSPAFTMVDVLNYFCSVQKEEHRKAACVCVVPASRKDTVILSLRDCTFKPILRLGETYSMSRIRRPPGIILPPLHKRPFLMHFPNFITLPLPRVTLRPFHIYSEEDRRRASVRRYFIQQQSLVEYYRRCLKR
ncbi:WD repeat-containing protein 97 [Odontesthes bonariensis]|uniref:WD repeat-containing protein 97 n=1 Tax=Odontesthes bonariensis TaxID=219752 RepID=UPI003F58707A